MSWEAAYDYIARGMVAIARRYSGEQGTALLLEQGYPTEMMEAMGGAGTRTFKCRGGMGLLGVIGKYGMYRFANTLALLDTPCARRGAEQEARGGRTWSNYTWHGDQAPGHPFVTGLQASDEDFNDLRNSRLHIQCGKNLVENKMPESHFFVEAMERGAKIVTITPEYSPPATKSDYWIPIRPATDTALFLGITRWLMDNERYDVDFVKQFTDFPLLVRADNAEAPARGGGLPGLHSPAWPRTAPSFQIQGLTAGAVRAIGRLRGLRRGQQRAGRHHPRRCGRGAWRQAASTRSWIGRARSRLVDGERGRGADPVGDVPRAPAGLRPGHGGGDHPRPEGADRAAGERHRHARARSAHPHRRGHQPLVPRHAGEPGAVPAADAHRQHRQAGRRLLHLGRATTRRRCSRRRRRPGPGFKGWVAEDPFEPNLDPARTARTSSPTPTRRTRNRPTGTTPSAR